MEKNEEKAMIPRLISISGSVHSGKTTVSRMIAAQMPNAFYIDGDLISSWVGKKHPEDLTIDDILPEVHELIIELIHLSLENGDDVIVDYPFNDRVRRQIIEDMNDVSFEAKWFLLKPDIEKVLRGSNHRSELNEWEVERIKYHYGSDLMKTNLAMIINSTDQTPELTVKEIMEAL